jgi:hypothetical protein
MGSSMCSIVSTNVFQNTPFSGYSASFSGTPHIYVPASLIANYQTYGYWSYYSRYFIGI